MKIVVATIGKAKQSAIQEQLNAYMERITWSVEIKEHEVKNKAEPAVVQQREGLLLIDETEDSDFVVVLDGKGKEFSSADFAATFNDWQHAAYKRVVFLIGGADGHSKAVIQRADLVLSFGKATWPHMLVRVMLLEQIYRAYSILQGHPYHRK